MTGPLALFTPAFALIIPTLATDNIGALAVFKGLSFICFVPLALFFIPDTAWYRWILLVSPTTWVIEAYRAYLHSAGPAPVWAAGAAGYALVLLLMALWQFRGKVYHLHE